MKKLFFRIGIFIIILLQIFAIKGSTFANNALTPPRIQEVLNQNIQKNFPTGKQETRGLVEFSKGYDILQTFAIDGNVFSFEVISARISDVSSEVFLILPDGDVQKHQIHGGKGNVLLSTEGEYQIQFLDKKGYSLSEYVVQIGEQISQRTLSFSGETLQDIEEHMNDWRKKLGKAPLRGSENLSLLAYKKSQDMKKNNYIGHYTLEGFDILQFAENNDFNNYSVLGENVAGGEATLTDLYNELFASAGHRYNMLNSDWNTFGMNFSQSGSQLFFTQIFTKK